MLKPAPKTENGRTLTPPRSRSKGTRPLMRLTSKYSRSISSAPNTSALHQRQPATSRSEAVAMSASSFTMELFTISETSIFLSGLWMTQDPVREECADEVPEIIKEIGGAVDRVNALLRQLHRMPRSPKKRRTAVDRKMLARMRFSAGALGASNELVTAVASNLPPI